MVRPSRLVTSRTELAIGTDYRRMRVRRFYLPSRITVRRAQPQFKDGSVYRQNRPTRLDKIKNLRAAVQAGGVGRGVAGKPFRRPPTPQTAPPLAHMTVSVAFSHLSGGCAGLELTSARNSAPTSSCSVLRMVVTCHHGTPLNLTAPPQSLRPEQAGHLMRL